MTAKPSLDKTAQALAKLETAHIREVLESLNAPGSTPAVRRIAQSLQEYLAGNTTRAQLYKALLKATGGFDEGDSAQSLSVKRASVEWHNFATLGQTERQMKEYAAQNRGRSTIIRNFGDFIGDLSPFLEIGASAGHTSYMLANEFGASGFALDISAGALRHGQHLMDAWHLERAPIRVAGDAARLPFRDGSLKLVMACQMLSQFLGMERVFAEVRRVLAPGGVFLFVEEPLKRKLTLRLYRCPLHDAMKPWERKLDGVGLLGYLVRDVIGADQEEKFGIRQNHTMGIKEWVAMIGRHFAEQRHQMFVPQRGWGEISMKRMADRIGWSAATLLGGTLSAACKKAGTYNALPVDMSRFETYFRCPDCYAGLARDPDDGLFCANCGYESANEGGVYNLVQSRHKTELYPGDSDDQIDFCSPSHEERLGEGWHELEGSFGNKYRWIGPRATATLNNQRVQPLRIRIRGSAPEACLENGRQPKIEVKVNGQGVGQWTISRTGLFLLEADIPQASAYQVEILAGPALHAPGDIRELTVIISMIRLVPRE
jgi:SAM-dependent methyltransferase